eukprot:209557_1
MAAAESSTEKDGLTKLEGMCQDFHGKYAKFTPASHTRVRPTTKDLKELLVDHNEIREYVKKHLDEISRELKARGLSSSAGTEWWNLRANTCRDLLDDDTMLEAMGKTRDDWGKLTRSLPYLREDPYAITPPGFADAQKTYKELYPEEQEAHETFYDDLFDYAPISQWNHNYDDNVHDSRSLIGGEFNDVSGSGSPLLIGGVVGASAVVIIILIFCIGLAFGMIIYWGYRQKRALDVKRKKEEMRWIDHENNNEFEV